ncbi:MAG: serine acetyltransferase [Clostridia bacterium]|nr:serine acetyltransferase [Clostridia bacterium]
MNDYKDIIREDYNRWGEMNIHNFRSIMFVRMKRWCEKWKYNKAVYMLLWIAYKHFQIKYGCDIPVQVKIGKGFRIEHLNGIVINPYSEIGNKCTILNGVLLGNERRGKRKGTPKIGNNVYIGSFATIVGNVKIGDDVLIAPGTFINFDVPSHSVVFGNPGIIKHRDNATDGYI